MFIGSYGINSHIENVLYHLASVFFGRNAQEKIISCFVCVRIYIILHY